MFYSFQFTFFIIFFILLSFVLFFVNMTLYSKNRIFYSSKFCFFSQLLFVEFLVNIIVSCKKLYRYLKIPLAILPNMNFCKNKFCVFFSVKGSSLTRLLLCSHINNCHSRNKIQANAAMMVQEVPEIHIAFV